MLTAYDKNGKIINDFDKFKIIALHKFDLNRTHNYNFEYEYILNSFKSEIEFHNSDEIFEVYYAGLKMGGYYTEKCYLICKIGYLDQYLLDNFDVKFKTFFEHINSYGELYIENKRDKLVLFGLEFDEIDTAYVLKDGPIIQFTTKDVKFNNLEKYSYYSILNNLESKKIFEKLKSNIYQELE